MTVHRHPSAVHGDERRLDAALAEVAAFAADSLRRDEERARRRRRRALLAGALVVAAASAAAGALLKRPERGWADVHAAMDEGWSRWRARRPAEAETLFARAVADAPDTSRAWNGLGWSRLSQGNDTGAQEAFARCLALDPAHPACRNGLGQLALRACDYATAVEHLEIAAGRSPVAQYGLTAVHLLEGRYADAERWAVQLVASSPGHATAQQMLEAARARRLDDSLQRRIRPHRCP
jgi:Flp pilus assembly protein TadD